MYLHSKYTLLEAVSFLNYLIFTPNYYGSFYFGTFSFENLENVFAIRITKKMGGGQFCKLFICLLFIAVFGTFFFFFFTILKCTRICIFWWVSFVLLFFCCSL